MPVRHRAALSAAVTATALLALAAPAAHAATLPAGRDSAVGGAVAFPSAVSHGPGPVRLTALGAGAHTRAAAAASVSAADKKSDSKSGSSSMGTWLTVAVFFVASVGIGFLLSGRNRRKG